MTEQEIVKYLKENENKGIVFEFMPEEVKKWCKEHFKDLVVFTKEGWTSVLDLELPSFYKFVNVDYDNTNWLAYTDYLDLKNKLEELKKLFEKIIINLKK